MPDAALRILVIEDSATLGRFITAALVDAGWVVLGRLPARIRRWMRRGTCRSIWR